MKTIVYKDKKREVVVINKPTDNYFMLDLSEYDEKEREYYEAGFKDIHNDYIQRLKDLGISSNYRYFNKDKITWK